MNLKEVLNILISKFNEQGVNYILSGGMALSTMDVFRFTKDIDFLIYEESKNSVHKIMVDLGYERQDFGSNEILSYWSPLKFFGQVDFLLAKRKYTKAMMRRAKKQNIFDGELEVRTICPEDLIGLKIQAISNDPETRFPIDASDIQTLLSLLKDNLNMGFIREYFKIFDNEDLLNEWLSTDK